MRPTPLGWGPGVGFEIEPSGWPLRHPDAGSPGRGLSEAQLQTPVNQVEGFPPPEASQARRSRFSCGRREFGRKLTQGHLAPGKEKAEQKAVVAAGVGVHVRVCVDVFMCVMSESVFVCEYVYGCVCVCACVCRMHECEHVSVYV